MTLYETLAARYLLEVHEELLAQLREAFAAAVRRFDEFVVFLLLRFFLRIQRDRRTSISIGQ